MGGKYDFFELETGKTNILIFEEDIILGNNGALALNWVPSTGILSGAIRFYTHVKGDDE